MKNLYLITIVLFTVLGCASTTKESNNISSAEITKSIYDGQNLYKAFTAYDSKKQQSEKEVSVIKLLKNHVCEGLQYIPFTIERQEEGLISVYYMANTPIHEGAQFGRHYRVDHSIELDEVSKIYFSTNGCVLIPDNAPDNAEVAALYITHVRSDYPTEFHVFMSYLHDKEIYVGTSTGNWKVNKNSIEKM